MTAHELVAGFVLDALDSDDELAFQRHLEVCTDCEAELEPLRLAAVALAFAGELPRPRPELRLRVLDVGGTVIPLRRPSRLRLPAFTTLAAAAACAAVVFGLQAGEGGSSPAETRALAVLKAEGTRAFAARGSDATLLVGRAGDAVLVLRRLHAAAAGTAYEVWVLDGPRTSAAGFVSGRLAVLARRVPPGATVAVSLEPAGGSPRPTGPLLLRAETA